MAYFSTFYHGQGSSHISDIFYCKIAWLIKNSRQGGQTLRNQSRGMPIYYTKEVCILVFSGQNMTIWCYRKHQLQNLDVEIKKWNQLLIICSITTFLFLTKKEKDAFNLTYLSKNAEIPTKERTLLNTQLQFYKDHPYSLMTTLNQTIWFSL